ncbi:MAG: hypothetical protein K2Q12_10815 [Rickettsiales bacterium]|nr:hypothetical protein [Rickettsiales bacterium]
MSQIPPEASSSPRVMIEQLYLYIDAAHDVLEAGDYISLAELDSHVQELCQSIMHLPIEEAALFRAELQELMEALDDLKAEMEKHKSALSEQMGGLSHSKHAAKAYQKSHHMDMNAKREEEE